MTRAVGKHEARSWISFENAEGLVETFEIGLASGLSEGFDTVRENFREIGLGEGTEPNLSHARRR